MNSMSENVDSEEVNEFLLGDRFPVSDDLGLESPGSVAYFQQILHLPEPRHRGGDRKKRISSSQGVHDPVGECRTAVEFPVVTDGPVGPVGHDELVTPAFGEFKDNVFNR